MTASAKLERVLQGQDPVANSLIGYLLAKGWSGDRIVKNVAMKMYSPNRATVRVTPDLDNQQYWVKSEYHSAGENVLSSCFACIKATASPAEMNAAMSRLLQDAESRISQSFAVRHCITGQPPQQRLKG